MRNGDCPLGGLSTAHRGARSSKHALNASIVISDPNFDLLAPRGYLRSMSILIPSLASTSILFKNMQILLS